MIVSRRTRRLNNKNIAPTNVLLDFDVGLAVGKCADRGLAQRHPDVIANAPGQLSVGRTAEYLHFRLKREHRAGRKITRAAGPFATLRHPIRKKTEATITVASAKQRNVN